MSLSPTRRLWLLVDPVKLGALVADHVAILEPESDLLLGVLDAVGAVADVAADIDGEVAADGTRGRGKRIGGTEDGWKNAMVSYLIWCLKRAG
jgi:hypothetical protein